MAQATKNLVRGSIALLLALYGPHLRATTYYVSPNGNDNAAGTSPAQAWRTLARAQQVTSGMQPGDAILFERGGTYPGSLDLNGNGTAAQPIIFGAYGSGDAPIISGGEPVTGWVQHQGNIWSAPFPTVPKYVIVNGEPMTEARHPNTGWLHNTQGSQSTISNSALAGFNGGAWAGATVVMRTENWRYDNRTITGLQNGTVSFTPNISFNMGTQNWGFFLKGALPALDMPGEWCYDAGTGRVYLWAPDNADPNGIQVLASIHQKGFIPGYQKQHLRIQDLCFQGQTQCGISTEMSQFVTVTGCTFRYLYKGISSSGNGHSYVNNVFHDTYDAAIHLTFDNGDLVEGNTFTDIAMVPGMGDSGWGYIGIRASGPNNVIRNNRLENVGYCGISVYNNNVTVERNVVINATSILNDGAGITFDEVDGLIVRHNVVLDMEGDLSTVADDHYAYYPITFGIYFGNSWVMNTLVEGNTVARCRGAGIHVDHTMMLTNVQVIDNVLYDNGIQMSLSDFSNNEGPGAVPPFVVPAFNTVYDGNIMYSVRPDQLCLREMSVWGTTPVDFGTFTNNRYFSPYQELSILRRMVQLGYQETLFTLAERQQLSGDDIGSTSSPRLEDPYDVTQVLGQDLIVNGTFGQNVSGWTGWPSQGQFNQDMTYLDNGAMRVEFTNPVTSPLFYLHTTNTVDMLNGEYYRLRLDLQSSMSGEVTVECKGQSQLGGPNAFYERTLPFGPDRRDLSLVFQSDRTEPVRFQLINHHNASTYWVDNIHLERVSVVPVDPYDDHVLLVNDTPAPLTFTLDSCWSDVNGNVLTGDVTLAAFRSMVVIREPDLSCGLTTGTEEEGGATAGPALIHPNPALAGGTITLPPNGTDTDRDLQLFDGRGALVWSTTMSRHDLAVQLPEQLVPGLYIARAGDLVQRLIIE